MSVTIVALITFGVLGAIGMALEAAPKILRARADLELARQAVPADGYGADDLAVAVVAGIRRADPDLGAELVERLAQTVLEDLDNGVIGILVEDDDPRGAAG